MRGLQQRFFSMKQTDREMNGYEIDFTMINICKNEE